MATYKVWLTVKDGYGNTKDIDGGVISVDFDALSPEVIEHIEEALPLEDYLKKSEIAQELDHYATDSEVSTAVQNTDAIKYSGFFD